MGSSLPPPHVAAPFRRSQRAQQSNGNSVLAVLALERPAALRPAHE
jgi:hypothetical protein